MKQLIFTIACVFILKTTAFAQHQQDENEIKQTIHKLFDGMRTTDSTLISSAFSTDAILQTVAKNKSGKTLIRTEPLAAFIKSISLPHNEVYDERVVFTKILIDQNLASVWTDYKFYIGDKFSHCGVNSFQLVKLDGVWKIIYLIDTRRKDNCN